MKTLDFKSWILAAEDDSTTNAPQSNIDPADTNPVLNAAKQKAKAAVQSAIARKKNPIQAAQQAVAQSNVPTNKLGKIMPQDPDANSAM